MSAHSTPRRSCLSVPADDPRKVAKAASLAVDEIVLDLEDAVAAERKADAQQALGTAFAGTVWRALSVAVRVNAPRTPWAHLDLMACARIDVPLTTVVVPKVETAGDVAFVDRLLDGAEREAGRSEPIGIQALVETAEGLERLPEIAAASPRLRTLILGYADLAASLGRRSADTDTWLPAQEALLWAARRHGLQALDGPYLGLTADERFEAAVRRARDLGFDGKWAIHPCQVPTVTAAFSPSAEEVAWARQIIDALGRRKAGAVAVDGQMVDEAVVVRARRVLANARELSTP
ncbi:HpcH/HpaI aldolase/citrate lyase family protein [Streptomyces rhizosphaericus]|uniref:CoA ester lyase n=1 Tax=Streptomyces rhizosphaericus TaxID=114699 RepID=A0A6G4AHM7_9ACTN|nr:CoA ester lyase [Streptomyces rhizosphaericus]NEW72946.1 CoA ester lyase [Streptomyces rhizosphaericus]